MLYSPEFTRPTRLQRLQGAQWQVRGIQVFMKREDERDALLGGNKWCKLLGHLEQARADGMQHLVSVGGLWSNHLHALAHAGQRYGFATTGIVRGEAAHITPTLREAQAAGMQLKFVSREEYRQRHEAGWQAQACVALSHARFIPEGGAGEQSLSGLQQMAAEIAGQVSGEAWLAVAVGSGTTLAGLRRALPGNIRVQGFQAFADASVPERIAALAGSEGWQLHETQGMRQHARLPQALADFMQAFSSEENIELDSVYTVRLMARLDEMIRAGDVPDGCRVICLHSGGLQGRRGHSPALAA
ncbi:MAG: pyridoxal-phosphate dependent enzyme [Pedobacter sp.]|nr:pyridoxal-phosphate dependent enzyme [Pedobacter sp.]